MSFVHLHNHSDYSLLDGVTKIDAMVEKAKNDNQEYIALTDHGNMFGALDFYKTCIKAGIKPIVGFEAYVAENRLDKNKNTKSGFHLTLLAKDNAGYQNLLKLSTFAYTEGFYYKPRIDKELLRKYSEGIMAGSACLHGEINYYLLNDDYEKAKKACLEYQEIFGKDNFFIEIMRHDLPEQIQIEPLLLKLSNQTNTPIVATNDCHYLNKEDAKAQDALLCIQTNRLIEDTDRMRMRTEEFYFKTQQEMYEKFKDLKEAVDNSYLMAKNCSIEIELGKLIYPVYSQSLENDSETLEKLVKEGLEIRMRDFGLENNKNAYYQRLEYELGVIKQMNFSGYFLIVWDFINYAKSHSIPVGPGRGSAAGSLVSYSLGITDIDPIKHNLLFERFLNPDRISMPDIDMDFCIEKRNEVIKYVLDKYGYFNVAQVGTFGTLGARNVLKDVGRVMGMPFEETNKITKHIPDSNSTIQQVLESNNDFKQIADTHQKLFTLSKTLEGCKRHFSTHAAGIVISTEPIYNLCPLYKSPDSTGTDESNILVTQYEKEILEDVGLIKFDFLGLKNLTVIDNALKMIENKGITIDWKNIDLNDRYVYEMLSNGDTTGVFQLESSGMQGILKELKPTCFEDLVAVLALYRPGPLGSGMIKDFIERKQGKQEVEYFLPQLEPILKDTYGVIVYQEQVMQIANVLAGYTMSEADVLRKIMGKKQVEKLDHEREKFLKQCAERNVNTKKAVEIFNLMAKFAEYGFNKAHSTAYAYISFRTAYLKRHYPEYFMCALMEGDAGDFEQTQKYIENCRRMNIDVLPPDINLSKIGFSVSDNNVCKAIRFGFSGIKNLGSVGLQEILFVKNSLSNRIPSVDVFFNKVNKSKVNSKIAENLIKAGVFDSLDKNRKKLLLDVKNDFYSKKKKSIPKIENNENLLFLYPEPEKEKIEESSIVTTQKDIMDYENEVIGMSLTVNYYNLLNRYEILSFMKNSSKEFSKEIKKGNNQINIAVKLFTGIVCDIEKRVTKKGMEMFIVSLINHSGIHKIYVFNISDLEKILEKSNLIHEKIDKDKSIDFSTIDFFNSRPIQIPCKIRKFNESDTYSFDNQNGDIKNWVDIKNEISNYQKLKIKIIYDKDTELDNVMKFMGNLKKLLDESKTVESINRTKKQSNLTLRNLRLFIEYTEINRTNSADDKFRVFKTNTLVDADVDVLNKIKQTGSALSQLAIEIAN